MSKKDHSPPVILVVDDSDAIREVLNIVLSERGYNVVQAADGHEAVEIATRGCPDLILMDLSMPVLDGYGAVQLLREVPETSNVPIVACTSHDTSEHRTKAFALGFNEYLTKPIDFFQLDNLVCRFLKAG